MWFCPGLVSAIILYIIIYFIETLYINYAAVFIYHTKSKTKKTYYNMQLMNNHSLLIHVLLTNALGKFSQSCISCCLHHHYSATMWTFYIECMKGDGKGRKYLKYTFDELYRKL